MTIDHTGHTGVFPPLPKTIGAVEGGTPYPEKRVWLEIHTWWEGAPLAAGQIAHVHCELWFPLGQDLKGIVNFDTRIVMHKNPGVLFRYDSWFEGGGGNPFTALKDRIPAGEQTFSRVVHTTVDTRKAPDGWYEYRPKARVRHSNGDTQLTSAGWPANFQNGNPEKTGGFRTGIDDGRGITGRGWYSRDHGYQNSLYVKPVADVLPGATVSGTWKPVVRLNTGSGGHPTTFTAAYIDPDFHSNPEDGDGNAVLVVGKWNGPKRGEVSIDTTKLTNGSHKLVLRTEARFNEERLVTLQYVPFQVQNPDRAAAGAS